MGLILKIKVHEFLKIHLKKWTLVLLLLKARIRAILKEKKLHFWSLKHFCSVYTQYQYIQNF